MGLIFEYIILLNYKLPPGMIDTTSPVIHDNCYLKQYTEFEYPILLSFQPPTWQQDLALTITGLATPRY